MKWMIIGLIPGAGIIAYLLLRPPMLAMDRDEQELEVALKQRELMRYGECVKCGYPVMDDYILCPNCQTQLRNMCPRCGKPMEPSWPVCPYCTTPIASGQPKVNEASVAKPKRRRTSSNSNNNRSRSSAQRSASTEGSTATNASRPTQRKAAPKAQTSSTNTASSN